MKLLEQLTMLNSWVGGLYFYCPLLVIKRIAFKSSLDLHFYDLLLDSLSPPSSISESGYDKHIGCCCVQRSVVSCSVWERGRWHMNSLVRQFAWRGTRGVGWNYDFHVSGTMNLWKKLIKNNFKSWPSRPCFKYMITLIFDVTRQSGVEEETKNLGWSWSVARLRFSI